jgi:tetratricopeptide (TPR) repeat protein
VNSVLKNIKPFFLHLAILLFVSSFSAKVFAQPTTDEQLAVHYFQNNEFEKALLYYEKLYSKSPTEFYYDYYLKCLLELKQYKEAEKLVKKQMKKSNSDARYQVDLGFVYIKSGEESKGKNQYQKAIKDLYPAYNNIIQLAQAFIDKGEKDYALETFKHGEKLLDGTYPFNVEIAGLYASMGKYEEMIDQYLSLLEISEAYIQAVQNSLQQNMVFEKNSKQNQALKSQLLKRIQKMPSKTVYSDMLIWLYIQEKDFQNAFIQAKALDKRMKEDGERIYSLAQLSASNEYYETAIQCYKYVLEKGNKGYYYINSKTELLNVMHKKILQGVFSQADLSELEASYKNTINELGKSASTISIIKDFAQLEAYYLSNPDTAILLLEEAILLPHLKSQQIAECKLLLGDILVIKNEIWDASLYYSQVDKEFKYDELGEQAKFRNAKIAYYSGDFKWAKAQLDVLKGSTSKLIANDAMSLSLLITDNTGIDTTTTPLLMFARAELLSLQNKDSIAFLIMDSITNNYKGHSLTDDILMQKANILIKKKNYDKAVEYLKTVAETYYYDILADDALYKMADIFQHKLNNPEKAKELYEKLIFDFPGSLYVVEARKRYRVLRGDDNQSKEDKIFYNN